MEEEAAKKPGYKTTEFWGTCVFTVVTLLMTSGIIPVDSNMETALLWLLGLLSTMGYTVSRTFVKMKETTAEAVIKSSAPDPNE